MMMSDSEEVGSESNNNKSRKRIRAVVAGGDDADDDDREIQKMLESLAVDPSAKRHHPSLLAKQAAFLRQLHFDMLSRRQQKQ